MSVLAIDAGTTGVTVVVVTEDGAVAAKGYEEFAQHFPRPGWVEHSPEEIWQATLEAVRAALAAYDGPELRAVGITNQRETVLLWDRETLADRGRTPVLPDDRSTWRAQRLAVPEQHGLALVGDADGTQLGRVDLVERRPRGLQRRLPDLLRGVLDPAGIREVLGELLVAARRDPAVGSDDQGGDAGRAGVDGEDGHESFAWVPRTMSRICWSIQSSPGSTRIS